MKLKNNKTEQHEANGLKHYLSLFYCTKKGTEDYGGKGCEAVFPPVVF